MEKERILIVEDDIRWTDNYRRWLDNDFFDFDAAETAEKALKMLRCNYYAIVLLDLSLNPAHAFDRTSEEVQKYLIKKPEGTKHIIISNHAEKEDIRLGAFKYKAFDTIFKEQFEDINLFLECVNRAVIESKKERPDFTKLSYEVFIGSEDKNVIEHKILVNFKPEGGLAGWFSFREKFFKTISPIYPHKTKTSLISSDKAITGLFWSRKLGKAISIVISGKRLGYDIILESVNSFLGWTHDGGVLLESKEVVGYYFTEPDLSPEDFKL